MLEKIKLLIIIITTLVLVSCRSQNSQNSQSWTQISPENSPPASGQGAVAFIKSSNTAILFGGITSDRWLDETWSWNGKIWNQLFPANSPPHRAKLTMAYDDSRDRVILFGGVMETTLFNDTWEWDGQEWHLMNPAHKPPVRCCHGMTYDSTNQNIVIYGGYDSNRDVFLHDIWKWDGIDWTEITNNMPEMSGHVIADFPANNEIVSVQTGGYGTWSWNGTTGKDLEIKSPPSRSEGRIAYDSIHQRIVLFGGKGKDQLLKDTWVYNGEKWLNLPLLNTPSARFGHILFYDPSRESIILFGGIGNNNTRLGDSWELKLPDDLSDLISPSTALTEEGVPTAVPPSPTATPAQVILGGTIQNQIMPGIIHPDKSLVIEFDQALTQRSDTDPLSFEPRVAGSFDWNDAATRLIFTPDHGFIPGMAYQITQSTDLHTKAGVPFDEPLVWQISTLSALSMAELGWQEGEAITTDERLITFPINFVHHIDWQNVEEEIKVEPAVPMRIRWWENGRLHQKDIPDDDGRTVDTPFSSFPDTNQMLVQVRVPLDLEQTYRFIMQEWVTDCTCNRVLRDAFEEEFALPPLRAELIQTDVVPQFRFNYRVDLENLLSAVTLNPEFETEWYAEWDGYETVLTMDPNNLLPNKILYDLGFTEPVYHENGTLLSPPNRMITFPTPIIVINEHPGREHWIAFNPITDISVTFAREMDEQSVADAFQIEPTVPGTFSWEDNKMIFQLEDGHLDAFSQYTITLGSSMKNSDGRFVLPEPYTWQFETSELPTDADFGLGTKVQLVDVNGRRAVQYRAYLQEPLEAAFGLYALNQEDALQLLRGEPIDSETMTEVSRWTAVTEPKELDDLYYASAQETNIPPDVPAGAYLMTLDAGTTHDELLVFISENTVIAKRTESQITVWTTKINGELTGNLDVFIVDEDGRIAANGRSSAEGIFQTELTGDTRAAFVIVQDSNDMTAVGLHNDWYTFVDNSGYYSSSQYQQPIKTFVYIHTDRPLYHPRDTVYFKAVLRSDEDVQMRLFSTGSMVTASLKSPDGEVLHTLDLETNAFGSVNGQFQLPETAVSGDYQIEILTGDAYITSQIFKVDAYQSGSYEVTVSTDAESYLEDDTLFVIIDSTYLTGEPVPNAEVKVDLFNVGEERWDQWLYSSESMTGTTDINGRFITQFELSHVSHIFAIEAVVDDGNGQMIRGYKYSDLLSTGESIQLGIGAHHKEPGKPITGTITVQDNYDKPVIGHEVNFELRHYDPNSDKWATVDLKSEQTDENGRYTFTFIPQELGYYDLEARIINSLGYSLVEDASFIVYSEGDQAEIWFTHHHTNELHFAYVEDVYMPREHAKLFIRSTVAGAALLTMERGDVQWQQIVHLTPPLTVVDAPISEGDAPNVFATIMVWKPYALPEWSRGAFNLPEYQLLVSTVNLPVSTMYHVLNVEILPNQESHQSGEETQITVRVTDHAGNPVLAELSLSVVDEAIFQLSPDFSMPIHDAFYFERKNQAANYDAMNAQRQLWYDVRDVVGDHDGLFYYGLFENHQNMHQNEGHSYRGIYRGTYGDFLGTAVWQPTLHTDANGEATVSFTLPDTPADWRINVRAITSDSQAGEAQLKLNAR